MWVLFEKLMIFIVPWGEFLLEMKREQDLGGCVQQMVVITRKQKSFLSPSFIFRKNVEKRKEENKGVEGNRKMSFVEN